MNCQLSLDAHVTALCHSGYYQLWQLGPVAQLLSTDAAKTLVDAFVSSQPAIAMHYCMGIKFTHWSSSHLLMSVVPTARCMPAPNSGWKWFDAHNSLWQVWPSLTCWGHDHQASQTSTVPCDKCDLPWHVEVEVTGLHKLHHDMHWIHSSTVCTLGDIVTPNEVTHHENRHHLKVKVMISIHHCLSVCDIRP